MLSLFLALTLGLAPQLPQGDTGRAPSAKEVAECVAAIEAAFEAETAEEVATRLQAVQLVPAEEVALVLSKRGLGSDDPPVLHASIELLGHVDHARALEELTRYHARERKHLNERELLPTYATLLQAIGRHGKESSIPTLCEDALAVTDRDVVRARVLGLANIRSTASVEALFDLVRRVDRRRIQPSMPDFRLAVACLTGADEGVSYDRWIAWWNDNKRSLSVPAEPPRLPKELQTRWDKFWGERRAYVRQTRRGERGGGDR